MKLPQFVLKRNSDVDLTVQKDEQAKRRMKKHVDEKSRAQVLDIQVGDAVLIRQTKRNK